MRKYQQLFLIAGSTMRHSPAMERAIALADATGAALHIAVFIFIAGPPTKAMVDFATHARADVFVMGNTHHQGVAKLLGSTTEHVLYQVPCSVLAIKVEGARKAARC